MLQLPKEVPLEVDIGLFQSNATLEFGTMARAAAPAIISLLMWRKAVRNLIIFAKFLIIFRKS
jgi:hypothetical protein